MGKNILFYFPLINERECSLSYHNLNSKSGFSGTETALVEVSVFLVQHGFNVTIVGPTRVRFVENDVVFCSINDFDLRTLSNYDFYCPLSPLADSFHQTILRNINKHKTKIVIWAHTIIALNFLYDFKARGFDIYIACVSEWVRNYYNDKIEQPKLWLTPNPININILDSITQTPKKRGKWIFHSTFERGGFACIDVFHKVRQIKREAASTLEIVSYYTANNYKNNSVNTNVMFSGSKSKVELFQLLAETEYFVYPLVLPNGHVHHDTFSCCILEALAMGVIVITWGVACIPSLYKDYVIAIQPPRWYPAFEPFAESQWFNSEQAKRILRNAVLNIDSNAEQKEYIRKRGIEFARTFTVEKTGSEFVRQLSQLSENQPINKDQ